MRLFKKYGKIKFPSIIIYLLIFYNPYLFISALEIENKPLKKTSPEYIVNNPPKYKNIINEDTSFYILGPGDTLQITYLYKFLKFNISVWHSNQLHGHRNYYQLQYQLINYR